MLQFLDFLNIPMLAAIFSGLLMFGLLFYFWQSRMESRARGEIRNRLDISKTARGLEGRQAGAKAVNKIASKTDQYYSSNDPKQKKKMQLKLVQAGYFHPSALGYFFAARFGIAFLFTAIGIFTAFVLYGDLPVTNKMLIVLLFITKGYFIPNIFINKRVKNRELQNRLGFPDVMDLMVVSSEAGLTTEASIERISQEIMRTHPVLSQQLSLAAIEIRAGKPLDEALRGFGDRVGLDEVQGFATMIQQSKELGTSVSDALRVYSDEMRHKRMMAAEEKAYALPAKLSIPVTLFILPIVVGVAVIPTAVRMMNG